MQRYRTEKYPPCTHITINIDNRKMKHAQKLNIKKLSFPICYVIYMHSFAYPLAIIPFIRSNFFSQIFYLKSININPITSNNNTSLISFIQSNLFSLKFSISNLSNLTTLLIALSIQFYVCNAQMSNNKRT